MTANPMPPMIPMSGPTGSMPPQGSGRFKIIDPLRVVRTHLWLLVTSLFIGVLAGLGVWGVLRVTMPGYSSIAQLRVDEVQVDVTNPMPGGTNPSNKSAVELRVMNEINRLRSQEIVRATLERPEVRATAWFKQYESDLQGAIDDMSENVLKITPVSGTSLINLAAVTRSKNDPRIIVDALVSVYMLRLSQDATNTTSDTRQVYVDEGRRLDTEISRLADRQAQFMRENQITSTELRYNEATVLASNYTQQIAQTSTDLDGMVQMHQMLTERQQTGDTAPTPDDLAAVNMMPEVADIQRRLDLSRENRHAATLTYGENSYAASNLNKRIAAIEQELELKRQQKLREMNASRIETYANSINSLKSRLESLQAKLNETKAQLTDMQQKLAEYKLIQDQLELAKARKAQIDSMQIDIRIVENRPDSRSVKRHTASTEPELTSPKPEVWIPGITLLVVALTTGLVFLFEMLDQRVKAPADVKMIPDAELLGTLPDAAEDPSGPTGIERVVEKYPAGLMAESFREVRAAIMHKMDRRGYKTLMLVSAQPRSGTSTVTQNLATSLAFHGRNVAVVDANFRRPAQHRLFDIANDAGLVDLLRGRRGVEGVIQKIDGLSVSVLTTGQAADAPPELLEGGNFRSVISELESRYDVVLIDAPPTLLASDARLLAKHVDAIVGVVRAVQDKRGMIERMTHRLGGQRADLLGVILNGVQSAAGGYFRKSYKEFYRYRENGHDAGSIDRTGLAEHTKTR